MSRIAYVNGRYLPWRDATVHVEDRGYQFSDGVYEVCEVRGGRMVDERRHMARLARSLDELRIAMPMTPAALGVVMRETIAATGWRRHRLSADHPRGGAARPCLPAAGTAPAVVVTARNARLRGQRGARRRTASRWSPCRTTAGAGVDIKSISLLPNVLAKQAAREQGAREAWFVDRDGRVTEGLLQQCLDRHRRRQGGHPGRRQRHPARHHPDVLIEAIEAQGLTFEERPFTVAEALAAREAFLTSASQIVMPVVRIDGKPVGDGKPGPVAQALRQAFHRHAEWALTRLLADLAPFSPNLCLRRPAGVPCNGQVQVRVSESNNQGHGGLAIKPAGWGPRANKLGQRQWRPTAHKTCKTPSSTMSAKAKPRSRSSW